MFKSLQKLFYENWLVLTPGKCFYVCLGSKTKKNDFILEAKTTIPLALKIEVLGITIESNLTFYSHLKQLCKKVLNKLNALARISTHLNQNLIVFIYNSLLKRQLSWTFLQSGPSLWGIQIIVSISCKKEFWEWFTVNMIQVHGTSWSKKWKYQEYLFSYGRNM